MIVYINPISLFPELHSDKIYGAILSTISELYPNLIDDVIKKFREHNPPFLISSAFPYIDMDNTKIRFYPKIILDESFDDLEDRNIIKEYDEIEFLQEEIFFNIINGELSINELLDNYGNYFKVDNLLLTEDLNVKNCYKKMFVSQNIVNRLSLSNKFFYTEGIKYNDFSGVFFNITFFDLKFIQILYAVFRYLKDKGFGSHISIGRGQFTYEIEEKDIFHEYNSNVSVENNGFVTLSRFVPTTEELLFLDEKSNYELDFKRGKNKFDEMRKQILFFKEGSTIYTIDNQLHGQLVDSGEKSVEIGYAFSLKIKE